MELNINAHALSLNSDSNTIRDDYAKALFKSLTSGELINKQVLDSKSGTFVNNPLFAELLRCEQDYIKHYQMMGYELKNAGDYFYLYDNDVNVDDKQSSKTRIYAAIILLVRYITQEKRFLYDVLTDVHYGVSRNDLMGMMNNAQFTHILLSSKLDSVDGMLKILMQRQLVFKLPSEKYVLSDAGKHIVEDIIEQHSDLFSAGEVDSDTDVPEDTESAG